MSPRDFIVGTRLLIITGSTPHSISSNSSITVYYMNGIFNTTTARLLLFSFSS